MRFPAPVLADDASAAAVPPMSAAGPGWFRQRMWLVDLLVALGVFLYNLPIVPIYADGPGRVAGLVVVSAVLCGVYPARRRRPLTVLGLMLVTAGVQVLLGAPILAADVMLLLAVYNVASRYLWWVSLVGAVAAVVWLLIAAVPHLGDDLLDIGQLGVLVVVTFWAWTWGTLVRVRRQYVAGLQERAAQAERERETNARIAVADERARIAREIHDIVSHSLSVVVLLSDGAAVKVDTEPARAKSAILQVRDTGRSALAQMRRMLGVLRENEPGSDAPQPDIDQLEALIELSRDTGMPVTLTVSGTPTTLPDDLGLTVYRLAQEALTNVRKHAGPNLTRVDVLVTYRPHEVELRITDDGQGPQQETHGHGLLGMRERVAVHDGSLHAGPGEAGGFEVVAVLPREQETP
ncbi:sensor histidine kinase [Enemella sp. A6]|uniref:sensor histidine kinase n=1 Tax=Enemella sp. A6 TaxID=3440152 RepID=UPI003EBA624F